MRDGAVGVGPLDVESEGGAAMEPYALLKPQMRYEAHADSLILHLRKHPILYRDYLAPSTLAKLNSTLQRPDISDDFRNQIQGILAKYQK